jgi:hypothetical protein
MSDDLLRYDQMVEDALRAVVRTTLIKVAEHGLPGNHKLYLTFLTGHPGVEIADHLQQRYPNDMTIVLEHQFWGLKVENDVFTVSLSFDDIQENLHISFDAIIGFADPSVNFALQFQKGRADLDGEDKDETSQPTSDTDRQSTIKLAAVADAPPQSTTDGVDSAEDTDGSDDNVIALETFRKK